MFPIVSLFLVLTGGVSAPAAAAPQQTVQQTIRTTTTDGAATATVITGDGKVVQATASPEKHVLIEMRARPVLDRKAPGSFDAVATQRRQFARDLAALDRRRGAKKPSRIRREYHTLFSGVAATVDAAAINDIRKLPNVLAVHEDVRMRAELNESVSLIGATAARAGFGVNGTGIKVAVIDTGIDYTHPDLGGCLGIACRVVGGYDYVNDDNDPADDNGHGTHVAGIVAANGTVIGVAPGATLLAYKVLDSSGSGLESDIVAALERAVLDGAKVANLSLGGPGHPNDPGSQAIDNATAAGMLSVVAAGNSGSNFQTIGSPGTARTALTVGAADKSWQMAYFSSRGYVVDDGEFVMKPEVVAPGVDIRSTVPASGQHGDPSRYKSLNGTSMASPHVAGAAALLLQWKPALTPALVKERLMSSAGALATNNVFTEGAGGVNVSRAFGGTIFATPSSLNFGVISERTGTVVRDVTLTIRNTSAIADTVTLGGGGALPAGATLQFIPSSISVPGSGTANVTVRLTVDAAVTPDAPDPQAWSTSVTAIGLDGIIAHVPAFFLRGTVLELTFDETPWFIHLVSASNTVKSIYPTSPFITTLVKSGVWDVVTGYLPPTAVVVHEQHDVGADPSLHVTRAQATRQFVVNAVDDAGEPLRYDFRRELALLIDPVPGAPTFAVFVSANDNYSVSDLSTRYLAGLIGAGADIPGLRFFTSSRIGRGISADVTLPTPGVPFRSLAQNSSVPAGATSALLRTYYGFALKLSWGSIAVTSGTSAFEDLNRTLYFQSGPATDVMLPLRNGMLFGYDAADNQVHAVRGPYFLHEGGSTLTVSGLPWFGFYTPDPDAILGPSIDRWDFETAPNSLPVRFVNSSAIRAVSRSADITWATHTASDIVRVNNQMPSFDLYRAGTFVGTYTFYFDLWGGISSAPGPHEIRSSSNYTIGATPGTSSVVTSFDTSNADPNPPSVSMFRIEQNGVRTPTPLYLASGPGATVKFRVTDDNPTTVTMHWRPNGTTTWTPLAVTQNGNEFQALPPMSGAVDLRIVATDSASNTFREEWTPAFIVAVPPPPTTPGAVTATRTGTTTISVSWTASSSSIGIGSYRIQRLPGNVTFDVPGSSTAFVDTTGVAGSAYIYRVTAIDANNTSSTPSAYDVATLVQFDDDPLVAGTTRIRGVHMSQLRRAIDAVRVAAGLTPAWANYAPATGTVLASHFTDLRDRLNEARTAVQMTALPFTQWLDPGARINAADLHAIRSGVK